MPANSSCISRDSTTVIPSFSFSDQVWEREAHGAMLSDQDSLARWLIHHCIVWVSDSIGYDGAKEEKLAHSVIVSDFVASDDGGLGGRREVSSL